MKRILCAEEEGSRINFSLQHLTEFMGWVVAGELCRRGRRVPVDVGKGYGGWWIGGEKRVVRVRRVVRRVVTIIYQQQK